jgi:hypothetical protein
MKHSNIDVRVRNELIPGVRKTTPVLMPWRNRGSQNIF